MLSKINRISNKRLIDRLGRKGSVYKTTHFVFKYLPSNVSDSKFAIAISKKVAPRAVDRNKLRRQLMESLRIHLVNIPSPVVTLIIQKRGTKSTLDYNVIDDEVKEFINQLPTNV